MDVFLAQSCTSMYTPFACRTSEVISQNLPLGWDWCEVLGDKVN